HRRDAGGLRRAVRARAARGVPARRGSPRHRPAPHGRLRPGAADPRDRAGDALDRGVGVWPRPRPVAVGGSGIRGSLREARRHRRAARGGARGRVTAGYALIVLAACFWGGSTSFGKHLLEAGVSTTALMEMRSVVSGAIVLGVLATVAPGRLRVRARELPLLAVAGVLFALVNLSYYEAIKPLPIATAVFLIFTAPAMIFVLCIAPR